MMTADPIAASTVPRRIATLPDPLLIGLVGAGPLNESAAQYLVDMHAFESARFSAGVHDMIEALVMYAHGDWAWTDEPLLRDKPIPGLGLSYRDLSQRLAQWGRANVAPDLWVRATELALGLPDAPVHDRIVISDVQHELEAMMIRGHRGVLVRVITPGQVTDGLDLINTHQLLIAANDQDLERMLDALVDQIEAGEIAT